MDGWMPDLDITVSEWAQRYRILDSSTASEPGPWRNERFPFLVEIMNALSPGSPYLRIVFMGGAQIGKTECGNNWIGSKIHSAPEPMMMVQPSLDVARRYSRQRLDPMFDSNPELQRLVSEKKSKSGSNSALFKKFPGGLLIITGANSSKGLRSMPIGALFGDEIDDYPGDINDQGDPLALAEGRMTNFPNGKVYLCSTPTIKDLSRIDREFNNTDRRRYFVPCLNCGHLDWLRWENMRWDGHDASTARMLCIECGFEMRNHHKDQFLPAGIWTPTRPPELPPTRPDVVGFHLSSLYSPVGFYSWEKMVQQYFDAKDHYTEYKAWWNMRRAETWEDRSNYISKEGLAARLETYEADVPHGVGALICSVDVQDTWLEAKVKGFGEGEESWLIALQQFHGDPGKEEVWRDLTTFRHQLWEHASGRKMKLECTVVDTHGHHTEPAYRYCKAFVNERVFAIRGGPEIRKPLVPERPSTRNRYRVKLFTLCVDTGKEIVINRLQRPLLYTGYRAPEFCHLPSWASDEYLEQLTSEKAVMKWVKNKGTVRTWKQTRERNEGLDLEVYCLAGLYILGRPFIRTLGTLAQQLSQPLGPTDPDTPPTAQQRRRRGRGGGGGWWDGWS